ncbi:MAG: AMP nucleosidase [Alphaproteobacteria bacterium]
MTQPNAEINNNALDEPQPVAAEDFTDPAAAVDRLDEIYQAQTNHIRERFTQLVADKRLPARVRAVYPEIRVESTTFAQIDSRLSYGHVAGPGTYASTITRPRLFRSYLEDQISLLIRNHGVPVTVGPSKSPMPLHFAFADGIHVEGEIGDSLDLPLRDLFDVPDLAVMDDAVVNGSYVPVPGKSQPLAPFTAERIDYSLHRLPHYTATNPEHFQNFVIFTNYQFYIDEFCDRARRLLRDPESGYEAFIEPGNLTTLAGHDRPVSGSPPLRMPQMPAYHLQRTGHRGITMINIGIGPSNAKTITDHVAVLRPHAWLMLGHCAGLRNTQALGDYVLAHGYVRDDHVLDADLPVWMPIPPLAEVQVALEQAVAEVTGLSGFELKKVMRTGTVATIDNRNWELRDHRELVQRFSQSRAIALDMESATVAANGFRFRVPYGTLLCVSDKPLHGELKLPGMASEFYRGQVSRHLEIGIRAMEKLGAMAPERLHSRKLRSFAETAFQ